MTPESLFRTALFIFGLVLIGLLAVLFFTYDAEATRACEAKGYSEEVCSWR